MKVRKPESGLAATRQFAVEQQRSLLLRLATSPPGAHSLCLAAASVTRPVRLSSTGTWGTALGEANSEYE